MREREKKLFEEHQAYLRGPLPLLGGSVFYERGFVDGIGVWNSDGLRDILAALSIDHPATRFLRELRLDTRMNDDAERTRARLAELGRDCRVVVGYDDEQSAPLVFLEGNVHVSPAGHEIAISTNIDETPDTTSYTYLVRTTVTTDAGTRCWWYGSSSAVTEETIGDESPFGGTGHVAPFDRANLEIVLRVDRTRQDESQDVLWLAGAVELRDGVSKIAILVRPCEAIDDELFAPPVKIEETPGPRGPVLVVDPSPDPYPDHVNAYGAVLPGVGVFDGNTRELVTESGPTRSPDFSVPGDPIITASIGGPAGALAILQYVRLSSSETLSLMRTPDAPTHRTVHSAAACGLWSPDGAMFALVIYSDLHVDLFHQHGHKLATVPLPETDDDDDSGEPKLSMCRHEGALLVARAGTCTRFDVAANTTTTTEIPHALGYGWRQYGAGSPSYHPQSGRVAWMMCVEFPSDRAPSGVTLIGWRERDGAYHTVSVADHGWADKTRFGNVTVLPDGRILAIGNQLWLVDPSNRSIRDLGVAGNYSDHPAITTHDGTLRLWSHGAGPWWIEL